MWKLEIPYPKSSNLFLLFASSFGEGFSGVADDAAGEELDVLGSGRRGAMVERVL